MALRGSDTKASFYGRPAAFSAVRMIAAMMLTSTLLPTAATAQVGEPNREIKDGRERGALADIAMAHELYDYAASLRDAYGMAAAARVLSTVSGRASTRAPAIETLPGRDPMPGGNAAPEPVTGLAVMIQEATLAAAGTVPSAVLDAGSGGDRPQIAAEQIDGVIAAGQRHRYSDILFEPRALAEVLVIAGADANLDLQVIDNQGLPICEDTATGATSYCAFTPRRIGVFTVILSNNGFTPSAYQLWLRR